VSRVLGFLREMLIAHLFGGGPVADAFIAAQRIPNLLRSVFAEGALSSAFVPTISQEVARGKAQAQRALSAILGLLLLATAIVTGLGIVFSTTLVGLVAPGFSADPQKMDLCVSLTEIMMPYIIFVSVVALLNGALNSVKIFGASAFAQVLMNVVLIIGAASAMSLGNLSESATLLSWSVVVGGAVQVVAQLRPLRRGGFRLIPSLEFTHPAVRETLSLMGPAILGAAIYISTLFSSLLQQGSVAWLNYADRITQLPMGVFTIALASVLLPTLSSARAAKDESAFIRHLLDSLRFTSFIIVPVSAAIFYFAHPLVVLAYERGNFTALSSLETSRAVQGYSFGLWSASIHSMLVRAFVARKRPRIPTFVGLVTLTCTALFSLTFMGPPRADTLMTTAGSLTELGQGLLPVRFDMGHVGLCLASSISSLVSFTVLLLLLNREMQGSIRWLPFLTSTFRCIFAAGLACVTVDSLGASAASPLVSVLLFGPMFLGVYLVTTALLRTPELFDLLGKVSLRRPR
jgi:putative peptidoglycan lipid II flippase